jgi:putative ABC transport system permease protein
MNFSQTIAMALKSLNQNKGRSVLTMLGIIIGVAAVIALVSCIQGINTFYQMINEAEGANRIEFSYWGNDKQINADMLDYIDTELSDLIVGYTPSSVNSMTIQYRKTTMDGTRIVFGNQNYGICTNQVITAGRDLTAAECENEARVCVIGEAVRKQLFGLVSPLDQKIKINGVSMTIVGVYKGRYGGKLNTDDQMVLVSSTLYERILNNNAYPDYSYIARGVDSKSVKEFTEKLEAYMKPKAKSRWGDYSEFYAWNNEQSNESTQSFTNLLSGVAAGVAGISLLVGGIGIMNIMLVSVTERTREIGIRMAIGARRQDIVGQFLIEAAAVSATGGLIGIAIGTFGSILGGNLMMGYFKSSPYLPEIDSFLVLPSPALVLTAFGISALLGVIFGLYPANKASKLQPVEALRTQ